MDPPPVDDEGLPPLPDMGDFKMPSIDELLKALEKMEMSEENKDELRASLLERAKSGNLNFGIPQMSSPEAARPEALAPDFVILLGLITLLALIFLFFGYKLYKSLVERERRREEKRRQKQQKKKK